MRTARSNSKARQRGVVMLITLIALVLLLLASAAMMRAAGGSTVLAGNIGFRRDLGNQAERGFVAARKALVSGALSSDTTRSTDQLAANYSSTRLDTNANGVPTVLASETAYSSKGMTLQDIDDSASDVKSGVTVRYVIDRQCITTGSFSAANCELTAATNADKGGSDLPRKAGGESRPVYRISVRVKGPRNTESFYQSTFAL
jgi:Tfp pilus assembly protein PilX